MKIRTPIVGAVAAAAMALFATGNVFAHATSIGYENAGAGAVTIWLGTYQHGNHHNEGGLKLEGVLGTVYGPTSLSYNLLVGAGTPSGGGKPAGLIDGVTNFYTPDSGANPNAPLVGTEAGFLAGCPACGPTNHWQGVTFTGLVAGDYQFTWLPLGSPTAEWTPFNNNMNGIFRLSGAVVNPGVPEPTTLALVGLALAGLGAASRRRKV